MGYLPEKIGVFYTVSVVKLFILSTVLKIPKKIKRKSKWWTSNETKG